jgi:hypothetical protein
MRRRMASLSCCANINATERVLSSLVSASSSSSSREKSSLAVALFARRRRGRRMTTTTSASFSAPGGERKRFVSRCSSSFASQSLSTELASKSRISDGAGLRNNNSNALFLLKDARRRRREDDGFQSLRNLKTLSGRTALASGGDFGRLGVRARVSFSFVSFSSLSLSLCNNNNTHKQNTSDGIYCVIFSTRERLWNEFKAEVTDRCVSLST